mmetsp:Transcript_114191/g.285672  ORF Transcript_114191/g.285672 Transcript_114191/m.285672 type:complete len:256 (+) Transcript_114191:176-943(+)
MGTKSELELLRQAFLPNTANESCKSARLVESHCSKTVPGIEIESSRHPLSSASQEVASAAPTVSSSPSWASDLPTAAPPPTVACRLSPPLGAATPVPPPPLDTSEARRAPAPPPPPLWPGLRSRCEAWRKSWSTRVLRHGRPSAAGSGTEILVHSETPLPVWPLSSTSTERPASGNWSSRFSSAQLRPPTCRKMPREAFPAQLASSGPSSGKLKDNIRKCLLVIQVVPRASSRPTSEVAAASRHTKSRPTSLTSK